MQEEIISSLRNIIDAYEYHNDPFNPTNEEIRFWRERYLDSLPLEPEIEKREFINWIFLATTSEGMINEGIENVINQAQQAWKEKEKYEYSKT